MIHQHYFILLKEQVIFFGFKLWKNIFYFNLTEKFLKSLSWGGSCSSDLGLILTPKYLSKSVK